MRQALKRSVLAITLCMLLCASTHAEAVLETETKAFPAQFMASLDRERCEGAGEWTADPSLRAYATVLAWLDFAIYDEETALTLDMSWTWAWFDTTEQLVHVSIADEKGTLLYSYTCEPEQAEMQFTVRKTNMSELREMRDHAPFADRYNAAADIAEMMADIERIVSGKQCKPV